MLLFDWTPEACAKLTELWHAGLSTRDIGQQVGCGKNACIGKARRLKLPPRAAVGSYVRTIEHRTPRHVRAKIVRIAQSEPIQDESSGILMSGLTATTCRWPLWSKLFGRPDVERARYCGCQIVAGKPYCAAHVARSLAPERVRGFK